MVTFIIFSSIGWLLIYNYESMHYAYISDSVGLQIVFCWAYFMVCFIIFEPKKDSININFDGVFRHRQITAKEDYSFGFLKILFSRNGLISLVLSIVLANVSVNYRRDVIKKQESQKMYYQQQQPATIQQQNSPN